MNIAAQPPVQTDQTIYLKDYQKPSFLVESINLDIQVYDDHTIVDSTLVMKRQAAGALTLLGRDLELKSIQLNGQMLSADQYLLDSEQLQITDAPDEVILQTQVIIHPESNTQLEGLYKMVICSKQVRLVMAVILRFGKIQPKNRAIYLPV